MHELSIAESICDVASEHLGAGQRLKRIHLSFGPFSGVERSALDFCFELTAKHKGLEGVGLEIETSPALGRCSACGQSTCMETVWTVCGACGYSPLTVEGGRELRITRIEVEEVEDV